MSAADVDSLLREPALVFGSMPPSGRDLDLLVSSGGADRLKSALRTAGWVGVGRTFARFADCTAYAVDVIDVSQWAPTERVVPALFEQSTPLPGYGCLRSPAPHHRLLILARRYAGGMRVDSKKRALLCSFSGDDWDRARLEAQHWRAVKELSELYAESVVDCTVERGAGRLKPSFHRRTRVICLSGVDGSGKSTQAHHLKVALERLGFEAAVEWTKITQDPVTRIAGASVKKAITKILRPHVEHVAGAESPDASGEVRYYPDGAPPPDDAGKWLRRQSRVLTWGWAVVVAFGNGLNHRRTVRRRPERVLICDRYVFDSLVHLHYLYGAAGSLRVQCSIVTLLSPRPDCTFFLDVPPVVARARKPEQYLTAELAQFSELYHRESAEVHAIVIDGTQPEVEIAAQIARLAWEQLKTSRRPVLDRLNPRRRS